MSREITTHKVEGLNNGLLINVLDEPGQGNACHEYQIRQWEKNKEDIEICHILFQKGPVQEHGINGISNEALLAVVRDRLECFQSGDFACYENEQALRNVKNAMDFLKRRTQQRIARGVEGTSER